MTFKRDLDPGMSPLHWFGTEFRRAREAVGMTQSQFGATVPCDNSVVSKVEAGKLNPTDRFLAAIMESFPHLDWLVRFYHDSQKWNDEPFPRWFEDWLRREQEAITLRIWQPLVVPGLLQTAEYARAMFLAQQTDVSDEAIDQLVAARLGRQSILDKPKRPNLLVVLDEFVLHRLIGSPKITYAQLMQVADMSMRSYITVQVVPANTGAHAGLDGGFMIASVDGKPDIMHIDAVEGQTVEKSVQVSNASIAFDRVRGDALPRGASRGLILKVAEEKWNSEVASAGASPATQVTAVQTASK
jgi:transcriptional regulator with XRE-family HTH domain